MVKINCCNRKVFAEAYIKREGLNDISNEMRRAKQFADGDLKAWLGKLDEKKKSENKEKYLKLAKHRKYIAQFQGKILARESDTVGLKTDGTVVAVGQNYLHQCDVSDWTNIVSISGKKYHTVGLKSDGTVVAVGKNGDGQCNVSDWRDIVAVAASEFHTVGLKKDGTVVAVGSNLDSKCEVSGWKNIISVAVGGDTTFGLKSDGTVVAVGKNDEGQCEVSGWTDIVAIAASYSNTIGLKSDGTVVAAGRNNNGQCNVSGWTDIIAIVVTSFHTIGLRSDGTVVATGENEKGQCNVSRWTNIVSISSLFTHTVGLKSDGTVMATGSHKKNQCDVFGWKDIVSISAGLCHTVGLKSDGTVVAVGEKTTGQCNVSDWKLFKSESEKEADYNTACSLEESNSETQIIDAIGMFRGLNNYRDSSKRADECELRLQELRESLMEAERRKADCARQTRINKQDGEYCKKLTRTTLKNKKAESKYLLHTYNEVSFETHKHKVWHIHGENRKPQSLILGHYAYGTLLSKYQDELRKRGNKQFEREQQGEPPYIESWIDAFIMGDVHIIGFGFDFSEMNLWWLLNRKKREKASHGNVVFYSPIEGNELRLSMLEAYGVRIENLGFYSKPSNFKAFYEAAIAHISNSISNRMR